VSILCQYCK